VIVIHTSLNLSCNESKHCNAGSFFLYEIAVGNLYFPGPGISISILVNSLRCDFDSKDDNCRDLVALVRMT
jgi:hypothetical protein